MKQTIELLIRIFSASAIRYFIIAGLPFLLFYKLLVPWFAKSKIQKGQAGLKDLKREILHSMQTTAVLAVIAFIVLFTPVKNITHVYTKLSAYPLWWVPVSLLLSLIIHDTYFYWMHRMLHHKRIFRYTHLIHHKSINPTPWASYSFHFFEACTEGGVLLVIAMLIPIHPLTVMLFTITSFIINVYGHLGYEVAPQWLRNSFLFELINTSVHHNLHHSKFKGNYGLYFRVWDRVMKTEHPDYVKEYDRIQKNRFEHKSEHTARLFTKRVEPKL